MSSGGYDEEAGFVAGLGYSGGRTVEDSSSSSQVEQLMQHYMQQCLDFHHNQEEERRKTHTKTNEPPVFIRPVKEEEMVEDDDNKKPPSADAADTTATSTTAATIKLEDDSPDKHVKDSSELIVMHPVSDKIIEESRARAQSILSRFQQQQQQQQTSLHSSSSSYAAQREAAKQREEQRKQHFWDKNVELAVRRQAERLEERSTEINAAQEWNNEYRAALDEKLHARYEQRKRAAEQYRDKAATTAGIGTQKRRRQQKTPPQQKQQQTCLPTVAVYVSGFHSPQEDAQETQVKQLFSSFGAVRKVHFYRDKASGKLKGDGLVIYELQPDQDACDLLQAVCGQMNGAELPSGCRLQVEPSQSNNLPTEEQKRDSSSQVDDRTAGKKLVKEEKSNDGNDDDNDDELEDFFSSV